MTKVSVLFVDDEEIFLDLTKRYLSKHQIIIFKAANSAKEALEILKNNSIDIVVSDYQMPEMNGLEFLEIFRRKYDLPFIIFTGRSREEVAVEALNLGANYYLQKGVDFQAQFELLVKIIIQIVEDYRSKKEIMKLIKENEERLLSILSSIEEALYIADMATYELLYVNKALKDKFGELKQGQKCYDYLQNRNERCPFCTNDKISGEYYGKNYIWEFQNEKNGRWYKCYDKAIPWPDGRVVRLEMTVDITDLKQTEEMYEQAKETYLGILNTLTEAIYVQNQEGVFLEINKGAEKMYGLTREELIGKKPDIVDAPGMNDLESVMKQIEKTFKTGEQSRFEFWAKRKDGSVFPKDVIVNKGQYFGKEVVTATARDITELKKAEKALKESEERVRILVNNLPEGYIYQILTKIDKEYNRKFTYISKGVEKIHGISINEVLEDFNKLYRHLPEEDKRMVAEKEALSLKDMSAFHAELSFEVKPETKKWILLSSSPRKIKENEIIWDGVAIDITERKQMEEALKESEKIFSGIFSSAPVGVSIMTIDGIYINVNDSLCKILEFSREEIIGKNVVDLGIVDSRERDGILMQVEDKGGILRNYEMQIITKNKKIKDILISVQKVSFQGIPHRLSVLIDITERKEAEEKIKKQNEELQSLARYMEHEMNNSTSAIYGYIELAEKEEKEEERKKWAKKVKKQIEYITKIMRKSTELAEAGEIIGEKEEVEMEKLVKLAEELVVPEEVKVEIAENLPKIYGDQGKLLLVFKNIFENAVIHGKPTMIRVESREEKSKTIISIENDGEVISDNKIEEIEKGKSKRLGYKIIMKILKAHGWKCKIVKEENKTKVEITIK